MSQRFIKCWIKLQVPGNRGYKYFGAAKELPGVRELFEQEPPPPPRKTRAELMKDIDAVYYGYMDDDDGILNTGTKNQAGSKKLSVLRNGCLLRRNRKSRSRQQHKN